MSADQTIAIVRRHNAWRRGDSSEMLPPAIIGLALDALCDEVERLEREVAELKAGFDAEGRTATEACCEEFKRAQGERIKELERELATARQP